MSVDRYYRGVATPIYGRRALLRNLKSQRLNKFTEISMSRLPNNYNVGVSPQANDIVYVTCLHAEHQYVTLCILVLLSGGYDSLPVPCIASIHPSHQLAKVSFPTQYPHTNFSLPPSLPHGAQPDDQPIRSCKNRIISNNQDDQECQYVFSSSLCA